jgi:hypothetical protein
MIARLLSFALGLSSQPEVPVTGLFPFQMPDGNKTLEIFASSSHQDVGITTRQPKSKIQAQIPAKNLDFRSGATCIVFPSDVMLVIVKYTE